MGIRNKLLKNRYAINEGKKDIMWYWISDIIHIENSFKSFYWRMANSGPQANSTFVICL